MKIELKVNQTKDGYYIATGSLKDGETVMGRIITQGRNREEVFDMIADACLTILNVKESWWNKMIRKLIIY